MQDLLKKIRKMSAIEYILYTAVILGVVGLDHLTKILAVVFLKPINSVPIIKGVLHLTYATNDGMAWGLFGDKRFIFLSVSTVMIIVILLYLYLGLAENKSFGVSLAMSTAGGLGNMIDRTFPIYAGEGIFGGEVVDFIYFILIDYPVFNVADSFVCVGTFLRVVFLIISIVKEQKAKRAEAARASVGVTESCEASSDSAESEKEQIEGCAEGSSESGDDN